jgi:hypothetical protein
MATAVVSAPLVEELAKGAALVIFYFWKRDEFDNVLDGIIYAAMTGLGFAMTENILYYGKSFAMGGLGASIFTFILRGVVSPFAHPLFTSMTGIGLGLAQLARRGSPVKFFAPVAGILLAMFLHCLWNLSASFGAVFFVAYVLIMVPAFLGIVVLVFVSLHKERKIIREYLTTELESGLLDVRAFETICSVRPGREKPGELWDAMATASGGRGRNSMKPRPSWRFIAGALRAGSFRATRLPPRARPPSCSVFTF